MKFNLRSLLLIPLFLGGCSGYKQNFDCPVSPGVGCKSVTQVNKLVDDHQLEETISQEKDGGCNGGCKSKTELVNLKPKQNNFSVIYLKPHLRIIFFPSRDEQGVSYGKQEIIVFRD